MRAWYPPRVVIVAWIALLALLALTVFGAYQPLGSGNGILALLIATTKALIVLAIFMELREQHALMIAVAGAGYFWLAILLWLAMTDFVTRPALPPFLQP